MANDESKNEGRIYLFVYGTLMRGMAAEAKLLGSGPVRFVGRAKLGGALYDFGPFPGAVREKPAGLTAVAIEDVQGEVFELLDPMPTLESLDAHEGFDIRRPGRSMFVRRRLPIEIEGLGIVDAWVYLYGKPVKGARIIPSGDWRRKSSQ